MPRNLPSANCILCQWLWLKFRTWNLIGTPFAGSLIRSLYSVAGNLGNVKGNCKCQSASTTYPHIYPSVQLQLKSSEELDNWIAMWVISFNNFISRQKESQQQGHDSLTTKPLWKCVHLSWSECPISWPKLWWLEERLIREENYTTLQGETTITIGIITRNLKEAFSAIGIK